MFQSRASVQEILGLLLRVHDMYQVSIFNFSYTSSHTYDTAVAAAAVVACCYYIIPPSRGCLVSIILKLKGAVSVCTTKPTLRRQLFTFFRTIQRSCHNKVVGIWFSDGMTVVLYNKLTFARGFEINARKI